jgi:hypothetical protein
MALAWETWAARYFVQELREGGVLRRADQARVQKAILEELRDVNVRIYEHEGRG